jgi:pyruvate-formate lyase-activating enzyme
MQPSRVPSLVFADAAGQIYDDPRYTMAAADGRGVLRPTKAELIALPPGSDLFILPGRKPIGFRRRGRSGPDDHPESLMEGTAVAAFLAPAWLRHMLPAAHGEGAEMLPLYAYCAVGFADDQFWVPAERIDPDVRQDLENFDLDEIERNVHIRTAADPGNDLLAHVGECATVRACPAARNYFLGRWEAPLPTSGACNSACIGCISEQPDDRTPTFGRIRFNPTPQALANLAVPHLESAQRAVVSFGQGCEGEPLLRGDALVDAIERMRAGSRHGTINLNTNGSRPDVVERMCKAGLNAIRVSINSAREITYDRYYLPRGYDFGDVVETLRICRRHGVHTSINWLAFPGVSDRQAEVEAMEALALDVGLDLIQVRNLNIDPDLYLESLGGDWPAGAGAAMGMRAMMQRLRGSLPDVSFGYFNPPVEDLEPASA